MPHQMGIINQYRSAPLQWLLNGKPRQHAGKNIEAEIATTNRLKDRGLDHGFFIIPLFDDLGADCAAAAPEDDNDLSGACDMLLRTAEDEDEEEVQRETSVQEEMIHQASMIRNVEMLC